MSKKFTNCKTCGCTISKSAKACPYCGAKCKHSKVIIFLLILVCSILILSAFIDDYVIPGHFCADSLGKSQPKNPVSYSDDYIEISYNGCVRDNRPWMTDSGMQNIEIDGISLTIENKTGMRYMILGSEVVVDGVTFSDENSSYQLPANSIGEYGFYSLLMPTLEPENIYIQLYIFNVVDEEKQIFDDYYLDFEINLD